MQALARSRELAGDSPDAPPTAAAPRVTCPPGIKTHHSGLIWWA